MKEQDRENDRIYLEFSRMLDNNTVQLNVSGKGKVSIAYEGFSEVYGQEQTIGNKSLVTLGESALLPGQKLSINDEEEDEDEENESQDFDNKNENDDYQRQ